MILNLQNYTTDNTVTEIHSDIYNLSNHIIDLYIKAVWVKIKSNSPLEKTKQEKRLQKYYRKQEELREARKQMKSLEALFLNKFLNKSAKETCIPTIDNKSYHTLTFDQAIQSSKDFACQHGFISPVALDFNSPLTIEKLFKVALQSYQGIILGEVHEKDQEFLEKYMDLFKEVKITQLYLEGLKINCQGYFDEFFKDRSISNLHDKLKDEYNHMYDTYQKVFIAADKARIRMMCFEKDESKGGIDRILGMNYLAYKVIQEESKQEKFAVVIGQAHLTSSCQGAIPGLAEFLQCPAILVYRSEEEKLKMKETYDAYCHSPTPPHATIFLNPQTKVVL